MKEDIENNTNKTNLKLVQKYQSSTTMNAIAMTCFPEVGKVVDILKMIQVKIPKPKDEEVVIKMFASALYADEIYAAQGTSLGKFFGPKVVSETKPYILGSSVSGVIVAIGKNVNNLFLGQEVISIPSQTPVHGVWAEYCSLKQERIMMKPISFSFVEAAGIKMPACVSWGAIEHSKIKKGDHSLVVGASGGLGILTVQYLKSLGVDVTGVCSGKNKDLVLKNGANKVVDYTKDNFADLTIEKNELYDCIFDFVGGLETEKNAFRALKKTGKFITVTGPLKFIGEKKLSWFELAKVFSHIAVKSTLGSILGPRYIFGEMKPSKTITPAISHAIKHNIKMPISQEISFELEEVKKALTMVLRHRAKGRIVINFMNQESD